MTLKIMLDIMSQPSRAVLLFVRATNIPHEFHPVALRNMEHKADDFLKVNQLGTVPAIVDDGAALRDSSAILRYLSKTRDVPDHWFPKDAMGEARVNEYLHWQHLNVRAGCALYFQKRFIIPLMTQKAPNEIVIEKQLKVMNKSLDDVEKIWLAEGKNKYITGSDKISVADIMACCELEQPSMAGFDVCEGRPILTAYHARIKAELNPHYDEVHKIVYHMANKFQGDVPGVYEPNKQKKSKL